MEYRHISYGANSALNYIDKRRKGEIVSLKTSFKKLNKALMAGIDWGRIMTVAGQSGSGKSTILELFKKDFIDLNESNFEILSFDFEMLVEDQIARYLASVTNKTLKDIYSATTPLEDIEYDTIKSILDERKKVPIFYVDSSGTPEQIQKTILTFAQERDLLKKNYGLVITIDHVLLTKGKVGEQEKATVDALMEMLNDVKKYFSHIGLRCLIICLGQLNREIEKMDRVDNPLYHFPNRNDIFAASSIYHTSDYVIITHRPSTVSGMKEGYGPPRKNYPKGLPLKYPEDETRDMIYWHIIKERFGKPGIIALAENFKHSNLEEVEL
jgi:archaellum biogenesis ATPase FlaH